MSSATATAATATAATAPATPTEVATALLKRLAAPRDATPAFGALELKAAGVHTQLSVDMNAPPTIRPAVSSNNFLPDPSKASLVRTPLDLVAKGIPNPVAAAVKDISSAHLEVQSAPPLMSAN